MRLILISILIGSFSISAMAKWNHKLPNNQWIDGAQMPKLIKKMKKLKKTIGRKYATTSVDLSLMSPKYKQLQKEIVKIKTGEEFHNFIEKIYSEYQNYPKDAKLLCANLLLLRPLRGMTYRLIPLAATHNITHSYLRNLVKTVASNVNVYLPQKHWKAGFSYLTQPYMVDGKAVKQISGSKSMTKEEELQAYMLYIGHQISDIINVVEGIGTLESPIVWDNQVIFGLNTLEVDEVLPSDRFRYIGEGERLLFLSMLNASLHQIHVINSYNMNKVITFTKDVGKLYGIDGFGIFRRQRDITGVPSLKITNIMKSKKYRALYTLRGDGGDTGSASMAQSYRYLKNSIYYLRLSREAARFGDNSPFAFINSDRVNPWDDQIERQLQVIERLVGKDTDQPQGFQAIRSPITGEVYQANLYEFFHNPPADLKAFFPKSHNNESTFVSPTKSDKKLGFKRYPNYYWGTPKSWNSEAWSQYFKKVEIVDGKEVARNLNEDEMDDVVRVMRQSFGSEFLGGVFAVFVE